MGYAAIASLSRRFFRLVVVDIHYKLETGHGKQQLLEAGLSSG
jgi:hypothetical protein